MKLLNSLAPHAHWLLRIALLSVFLYHALGQLLAIDAYVEAMGTAAISKGIVPLTIASAILELIGSVLLIWGGFGPSWATRLGGLLFAPVMLGAIFIFHIQHGWAKMELEFSLLMISLYFVLRGNDQPFSARVSTEEG